MILEGESGSSLVILEGEEGLPFRSGGRTGEVGVVGQDLGVVPGEDLAREDACGSRLFSGPLSSCRGLWLLLKSSCSYSRLLRLSFLLPLGCS